MIVMYPSYMSALFSRATMDACLPAMLADAALRLGAMTLRAGAAARAVGHYPAAHELRHAQATFALAWCYQRGLGVRRDRERRGQWRRRRGPQRVGVSRGWGAHGDVEQRRRRVRRRAARGARRQAVAASLLERTCLYCRRGQSNAEGSAEIVNAWQFRCSRL